MSIRLGYKSLAYIRKLNGRGSNGISQKKKRKINPWVRRLHLQLIQFQARVSTCSWHVRRIAPNYQERNSHYRSKLTGPI